MNSSTLRTAIGFSLVFLGLQGSASAQNLLATPAPNVVIEPTIEEILEQQLIAKLRATSLEQQEYVRFVVTQVEQDRLPIELVVAIQRYASRRESRFPLPVFERVLRGQAARRGVSIPPVRSFGNVTPEGRLAIPE